MPRFDGTGPGGKGAMTGRGQGRCNFAGPADGSVRGKGSGRGQESGRCRGKGRGMDRGSSGPSTSRTGSRGRR